MKPKRLIISGWGPYKKETKIDFEAFEGKGLFLVTGATGAGKTTVFDAISYALYGRLSGETREKNSVRSDFAEADTATYVELFMEHAGKEYHIVRNPEYTRPRKKGGGITKEKENAVVYFEDGTVLEGVKEVNARMQEILVLDYDQFKQITMIAQGEFARLLTASPKEKTAIFRDIFGTGIYENFTRLLREKAKALYGDVQEQKHKLEEDIKLLLAGGVKEKKQGDEEAAGSENGLSVGKNVLSVKELAELTEGEYWNYDAIGEELKVLYKNGEKEESALEKQSKKLQEENDKLTAEITSKELENAQIEKLEAAKEKEKQLSLQKEDMEQKKLLLVRARAAAAMEPYRIRVKATMKRLEEKQESIAQNKETKDRLLKEQKELYFYEENKEFLIKYLECRGSLEESLPAEKVALQVLEKTKVAWEKAKTDFEKADKSREEIKKQYEKAEKAFRYAAVGIAARMLKEGEPCPVCGSREHPAPAEAETGLLSEEELNALKEALNDAEEELAACQEKAVALRTKAGEQEKAWMHLKEQNVALQEEIDTYIQKMLSEKNLSGDKFWEKPYREQQLFIQRKTERISRIGALLEGEEKLSEQLKQEWETAQREVKGCLEELKKALLKEQFADEAECEAAALPKEKIAAIEKEKANYENEIAATQSIILHLEETLKGKETQDVSELLVQAEACKAKLVQVQETLKSVHAFAKEVKKTATRFAEGRKKMQQAEEEYGCVGDLANLASGNNARRLVFEQYVLAGYFEEILRAANLRFYKMTGGRYEMSRIQEAGDGRIKDSLEIQVMDYYTGKQRSVKTLSGGESFKASLSLALGMSDVIQAMSGGIKVDTLFIDEGFGALDSESLDQACETLMGLVENNRLIGIISHVPELRERIDSQIVIEKTNSGSSIKIHV
ncbi:MAG: SMC family ATPase [Lachnospiraceae bacterium]|nr:SMC family ATPase [Lachnospiraceae bacterium]